MRLKSRALLTAAPSLVVMATSAWATSSNTHTTRSSLIPDPSLIVEVAGADEVDRATDKQLKDAGAGMIPSEDLKQAKPKVLKPFAGKKKEQPKTPRIEAIPAQQEQPTAKGIPKPEFQQMRISMAGPYLRLDVGYAFNSDTNGTQSTGALSSGSIDSTMVWGGGAGYRFNKNLRSDLTVSYRPDTDISATTSAGNIASTQVSALSLMLNGYWDIATFEGLTPYLGASIGYARLSTSDQTTTGGIAIETGATSDNLAWSLSAGAAYLVSGNTSVDLNYRYLDLGEFKQSNSTSYDSLSTHEVRTGLRVSF